MIPWELIDRSPVPSSLGPSGQGTEISSASELMLYRRGEEWSIRVDNWELMNSRSFGSEEDLASLAVERWSDETKQRTEPPLAVLVGGLGLGFTLRAALDRVPPGAEVAVAELVPAVVEWNRKHLGHLADRPLDDPRASVVAGDVADHIRSSPARYDAILLDVDNGPHNVRTDSEGWLYSPEGLTATREALRPGGVLSIWSAGPSRGFTSHVARRGFTVDEVPCRGRRGKGARHTVWVARRKE